MIQAVEKNNFNVGGGNISQSGGMLLVRGLGRTTGVDQIRQIVVRAKAGVPIRVADVADVVVGHEIRRGAVTADGQGEVVLGLGFLLMGENSHTVTWAMKEKLKSLVPTLPPNVRVLPVYDRTQLVDFVIDTVRKNLFEGGLLVVAVLFTFLGNLRAALIVAAAIPLSMLFAFCGMLRFGIAASLLSLGAIDFGMIVDSSVVMIENCVRHLASDAGTGRSRLEIIRDAAVEVRKPTIFGELIIMIVYLPILTLEGVEGKMFRPMALTVIFALVGSMILSITLMPVLASLLLPRRVETREPWLMRVVQRIYQPILRFTMRQKAAVIGFAVTVLVVAFGMIAPNLGSEFVPRLSEGAVAISVVRLAGTDLAESVRYNTEMEKLIRKTFPDEVDHVWSRIGTAEIATDPMGVELTDVFVTLKSRSGWKKCRTQAEFTELLDHALRDLPGQRLAYSQPIEMRLNEMVSGVRADLGVKLFGDDFKVLTQKAAEIEAVLRSIPGAADVNTEQLTGQPMLEIKINQDQVARYGIPAKTVLDFVESIGSKPLGDVVEGQLRFPLVARLVDESRRSPEAIGSLLVPTASGERIPLSRLAKVSVVEGPSTITREWGQRRLTVTANVRGRDLGSFVAEARQKIAEKVSLPSGRYRVEYGGQFENLQRAQTRLLDRRAARAVADLRPALRDVSQHGRRTPRLHRDPVRVGRRDFRPVAPRHAVFDLGGDRFYRHVGSGRPRRHDSRLDDPPTATERPHARRCCDASGQHPPAARADDDPRCQPRLPADGLQRRHGSRSAAAARHRGDRRRDRGDGDVAAGAARPLRRVQHGPFPPGENGDGLTQPAVNSRSL